MYPKDPFNFFFQDEYYNTQYQSEVRMSRFYMIVAMVSIILSCLGLYGMILFYIQRKIKEIGIRKVNGAKINEVMIFLNRHIVIWLIIATAIAIPVSLQLISKWLENFTYKTTVNWWIFAGAGLLVATIALLTVSWQSYKAATKNPVESLRYE